MKAALIASQIQLNADQIVVQNGDKTAAAFIDGKLRAACIDAENLVVQQLKIDSDKNSNQDFEAYFDKIRGLQIKNRGEDILKIDPKTGEAFFTGKVQAGAVELAHGGVFIRNGEISIENNGWKGVLRPCEKGVELAILGGDGGNMTKRQLWTYIAGGVLNLFVLGSITSCGGMYNTSPNGDMKPKKSGTNADLFSLTYGNNTWIASGLNKAIIKSTDNGETWTKKNIGTNGFCRSAVYSNNTWVAVGDYGAIIKSTDDGETWTKKNSGTNETINSIVYANNTWIAVGYNGAILKSTDDGETWTKLDSGTKDRLNGIATDGMTFVAVGSKGTILSSTDAVQWKE